MFPIEYNIYMYIDLDLENDFSHVVFSLLHRPLFTKLFTPAEPSLFPTTKHIVSPDTITREKKGLLTLDFDLVTHHTLTLFSQPQKSENLYAYLMK